MAHKAKHGYGRSQDVNAAIAAKKIDSFDVLFLDGDTDPKIGWVDADGIVRIPNYGGGDGGTGTGKQEIVRVTELPTANGDSEVIYIFENRGYTWDGTQCVPLAEDVDVSELETQVSDLETQLESKVDEETVQSMIDASVSSAVEVVEF